MEERTHGRPAGVSEGAAGHDNDGILALKRVGAGDAGGFDVLRAVKNCSEEECVEVTSTALQTAEAWAAWLVHHGVGLAGNQRETRSALVLFRRAARIAVGCNGKVCESSVAEWGTSVLLGVRRLVKEGAAKTLVFFFDGAQRPPDGATLETRIALAKQKWFSTCYLSLTPDSLGSPLVHVVRCAASVATVCADMQGGLVHRTVPPNSDEAIERCMRGMTYAQRSANGGESFSCSSQESQQASGSQASQDAASSAASHGTHHSPGAQSWASPQGVTQAGSPARAVDSLTRSTHSLDLAAAVAPASPWTDTWASPVVGLRTGDDSELSMNATVLDDSMELSNDTCCAATLQFGDEVRANTT